MNTKHRHLIALTAFLLVFPFCSATAAGAGVTLPKGTSVDITYQDGSPAPTLKPAEQVALTFLLDIQSEEMTCQNKDHGFGRPCSLDEVVKGAKTPNGRVLGLKQDPRQDANYQYSFTDLGGKWLIQAMPQKPDLAGFLWLGDASGFMAMGQWYYKAGDNTAKAKKLGMVGYNGDGFIAR